MKRILAPYVCLSALQLPKQADEAARCCAEYLSAARIPHFPCLGFALNEELLVSGYTKASRKVASLSDLESCLEVCKTSSVRAALHFDLLSVPKPPPQIASLHDLETLFAADLAPLEAFADNHCPEGTLIQLNGVVSALHLEQFRTRASKCLLIYPLSPHFYSLPSGDRRSHILQIAPLVDYLLIDSSGGRGIPFSSSHLAETIEVLASCASRPLIGIAGGLREGNIAERIREASSLRSPAELSFDIESGIRDTSDEISVPAIKGFLRACAAALNKYSLKVDRD